ncbi:872_t:CDS:2 [Gigaspora rosea]|nr:872_t:CDS:2 [Gigaspora rosea]
MAKDKWNHLKEILLLTDNGDPLPTNRLLHVYLFYNHKLSNICKRLWKNEKLTQWGKFENYFERDEFQNRGTIHTHGFAYTSIKIPELIEKNTIRADLLDQDLEPELYQSVVTYQIHRTP